LPLTSEEKDALLARAITFIEIAQALAQQEGQILKAQIAQALRPEPKKAE
jgi:putative protein kinase ArgK-like GTPase of G3E family